MSAISKSQSSVPIYTKRTSMETVVVLVGALVLSLLVPVLTGQTAHAATCNTSNGHCYGVTQWPNAILGSITQLQTVGLYSVNDGYDHISSEMWLLDTTDDCAGNGQSWVEAGEATWYGHTGNWYFWADCRPGSSFYPHFLYQPSGNDVGNYFQYLIDATGTREFFVEQESTSGTVEWNYLSTGNNMHANLIMVGLETTNNSYSVTHANPDYFRYNQYHGTNGVWNYQGNPGHPSSNNPPNWTWVTPPANGNAGGLGETTCC